MDTQPIAVRVIELGPLRGMIVSLDDAGNVKVSYLGTDPLLNSIGFAEVGVRVSGRLGLSYSSRRQLLMATSESATWAPTHCGT
jgi:hypothetical protein